MLSFHCWGGAQVPDLPGQPLSLGLLEREIQGQALYYEQLGVRFKGGATIKWR